MAIRAKSPVFFPKRCVFLFLALAGLAVAQEENEEPQPVWEPTYWRAEFSSGKYAVAHDKITSIALQEYIMDGAASVTEVNIATTGSEFARFFYETPLLNPSRIGVTAEVIDALEHRIKPVSAISAAPQPVMKIYPATTHAHVIEFRLPSREMLLRLYDSVEESWIRRQSALFRPGSLPQK